MKTAGFGKAEKLKSRKAIDALFATGKSIVHAPLRVKYRFLPAVENVAPVLAGVSVSKRSFKRAVDRNRLKRLMREAYRLQKRSFLETVAAKKTHVVLFFIYTATSLTSFETVYKAMTHCLNQLQQKLTTHHEGPE